MKKRLILILLTAGMLFCGVFFPGKTLTRSLPVLQHELGIPKTDRPMGFQKDGSLVSHLPLVMLDTRGREIPGLLREDPEKLSCSFRIIDRPDRINRSSDPGTMEGTVLLSIRGNSSRDYPKKQFRFQTVDSAGKPKDMAILGMPAESIWVLNGSHLDVSMIRNYLAYSLAAQVMEYAPRCRLCEVFTTDSDGNPVYEGVYTMMEKIKVSDARLDLEKIRPGHPETSFLVQLTSHPDNDVLEHLKPDGLHANLMDLEYPAKEDLTAESLQYIEQQILIFEKALYDAVRSGNWSKAEAITDLESFIDYYVINEFFQNLDAGTRSTYLYQDLGGKIHIGPVWDFDGMMNNFPDVENRFDYLKIRTTIFYRAMFHNPTFVDRCIDRYHELRLTLLSDAYLLEFLDGCETYLEQPALRNCTRWYDGDVKLWQAELDRMREFIIRRGQWMDENFEELCAIVP